MVKCDSICHCIETVSGLQAAMTSWRPMKQPGLFEKKGTFEKF